MIPSTASTIISLLDKITNRTACLGIIGLGYVGLPTAVSSAEVGFSIL